MVSGQIGGVNTAWECLQYLEIHHEYSVLAIALSLYSDFQHYVRRFLLLADTGRYVIRVNDRQIHPVNRSI